MGHNLATKIAPDLIPILKTNAPAWQCHTYDGREFWCDTDFHLKSWDNFAQLLDETWEKHICLTGGEPLMHLEKVKRFIEEANERDIQTHIETSGTIGFFPSDGTWLSVSPKLNVLDSMIECADEIKLLVDEHFDIATVPLAVRSHELVYIQPINLENDINWMNVTRCKDILRIMSNWHLSIQLHKILKVR